MSEPTPKGTEGLEPYVLAMIVCDQVYIDPGTGKKSLLGIFSGLATHSLPARVGQLAIFLSLTDGRGRVPVQLRLVDADEENEPLFEADGEIEFPDPRLVVEMVFQIQSIQFPHAGEYRVQFFAYGTLLMERRIVVRNLAEEQP